MKLYQDLGVRKATENLLKPLKRPGIDTFEVREHHTVLEKVSKEEVDYFNAPNIDEKIITQTETQTAYSIRSLSFDEDNKWRLNDGIATIYVTIRDENFLRRVSLNQESFSKGDYLICKVKRIQYQTDKGLKTEYEVLEVMEHRKAPTQLSLSFDEPMDNE